MLKDLCVTTDYMDDVRLACDHLSVEDLDRLMAYSASLGASRHEWIYDPIWAVYDEDPPGGFDLLAAAAEAAHRHGLRFDVVFKPFEGGMSHSRSLLPTCLPWLDDVPLLEEGVGYIHAIRPFVAEHPEMRQARHPEADCDPGGRLAAIRLVKHDDAPATITADDITLSFSSRNGGYTRYTGPMAVSDSLEWRFRYPYTDRRCRVVTLGGLELPADTHFVLIQCRQGDGNFVNAIEQLVELVNEDGELIPSMPSRRRLDLEALHRSVSFVASEGISRYASRPEIREILLDRERFLAAAEGMFHFHSWWEDVALDSIGELAVMRGKPRHIYGSLHPIYPEVRQHWLEAVQFCIDRGVDGVNIRVASHNRPFEPWAYGFNEPVLAQQKHPGNLAEVRRINGEAYTQFLREAKELLHEHGKEIGVHIHGLMFHFSDTAPFNTPLPETFDWQWETWVREIADYIEFRGSNMLQPYNMHEIVDRIGMVTQEAGIPFIFQSSRSRDIVHYEEPHPTLAQEMDWLRRHPHVTTYNLYETAYISRRDDQGQLHGSPGIAKIIHQHWRSTT